MNHKLSSLLATLAPVKPATPHRVVVIGDFAKDLDDEHTLCLLAFLQHHGFVELACVVANLAPALLRAQCAKGTLKHLGLPDVPVGVGLPVFHGKEHHYERAIPYLAAESELSALGGENLLVKTLEESPDGSVILILQSGLSDAQRLLMFYPDLAKRKLKQVAIMGGGIVGDGKVQTDVRGYIVANNANNNTFDAEAALYVYNELQRVGIPMVITMRDAPYACQVPFSMYDEMAETGNPIGICLKARQQHSLNSLWQAVHEPEGTQLRGTLPMDRDRGWFVKLFFGGIDPGIGVNDDVMPFASGFNLYDPANVLAAVPELLELFFNVSPVKVRCADKAVEDPITHYVVGVSSAAHGIKDVPGMRDLLQVAEVEGLRLGVGGNSST